jgi:hypothetical protein
MPACKDGNASGRLGLLIALICNIRWLVLGEWGI